MIQFWIDFFSEIYGAFLYIDLGLDGSRDFLQCCIFYGIVLFWKVFGINMIRVDDIKSVGLEGRATPQRGIFKTF